MPQCFHCGLPVLEPGRWRAPLEGVERDFCCAGCEAVATTIQGAGLAQYYARRTTAGRTQAAKELAPAEIYDDPDAQAQFAVSSADGTREVTLLLDGIRCAACLWLNEQILHELPGVRRADINYSTRRAVVAWDPSRVQLSQIIGAIRAIGYDAFPFDAGRQDELERRGQRRALWRLFVAGFGAMQVMMYAFPAYIDDEGGLTRDAEQMLRWASLLITIPVILFACGPFFAGAWRDLKRRSLGMDAPIALGLLIAFAASAWATVNASGQVYFDSISMLAFLLLGARWFEDAARRRAARRLDYLARWMPSFALRVAEADRIQAPERIAAHSLVAGDLVLVPAGERIPADGTVVRGRSSCDESLLTGESDPVPKDVDATVTGGSVNLEQALVMRVSASGTQTQAAAIARLVERAAGERPTLVQSADRVARWLTPAVLAAAAATVFLWLPRDPAHALWSAVAVLIATCPCALALAAPVVLTRATAELLSRGAALTRASALEPLARATDVVLDKTGTLTTGRLSIEAHDALASLDMTRCLSIATALEAGSRHPLAAAFREAARSAGIAPAELRDVVNHPAGGVEGWLDGRRVRLGNEPFCAALAGGAAPLPADGTSRTTVYLADESGWLARFTLADRVRPGAADLVAELRRRGLRTHLVSGDSASVVDAMAQRLGIDARLGGVKPEGKLAYVRELQSKGRVVAMVGDGLNDAPVLAGADVSIAMGGGSSAAQQQGDLVLLGEQLGAVLQAFAVSQGALRLIRQSFAWALAYNALVLPAAMVGWIGPWEAAIGMASSSVLVMLNALRPLSGEVADPRPQAVATTPEAAQG